jgi:hypothetical protein
MGRLLVTANAVPSSTILVTLMKDALPSSEPLVLIRATRRNITGNCILQEHLTRSWASLSSTLITNCALTIRPNDAWLQMVISWPCLESLLDRFSVHKRRIIQGLIPTKALVTMGLHPKFVEINFEACLFLLFMPLWRVDCWGQSEQGLTLQYTGHKPQGGCNRECEGIN